MNACDFETHFISINMFVGIKKSKFNTKVSFLLFNIRTNEFSQNALIRT